MLSSPLPPTLSYISGTRDRGFFLSGEGAKGRSYCDPMARGRPRSARCREGVHPYAPTQTSFPLPALRESPHFQHVMGTSQGVSGRPRLRASPAVPPTPEPTCSRAAPSRSPIPLHLATHDPGAVPRATDPHLSGPGLHSQPRPRPAQAARGATVRANGERPGPAAPTPEYRLGPARPARAAPPTPRRPLTNSERRRARRPLIGGAGTLGAG